MSFKTNRPEAAFTGLAGYSALHFHGADAGAFLQAQTMNDVNALDIGHWQWNGWLSAKGRVIALFALLKTDAAGFLAVLPDFPARELQPLLQRYVFRSKVRIEVAEHLQVLGAIAGDGPGNPTHAHQAGGSAETGFHLDFGGAGARRVLWLRPGGALDAPRAELDEAWLAADIAHGFPRLSTAQREAWTPQMLSLERLRAFSLRKGCYPGQEIVARTHYLGQARRALVRLAGKGLAEGQQITAAAQSAVGSVVVASADGLGALAVIQQAGEPPSPLMIQGEPVHLAEFQRGMERPRSEAAHAPAGVGDSPAV